MSLLVHFERGRLQFDVYPGVSFSYRHPSSKEVAANDSEYVHLEVTEAQTEKISTVCLRQLDLGNAGISRSAWQEVSQNPAKLPVLIQQSCTLMTLLREAVRRIPKYLAKQTIPLLARTIQLNEHWGQSHCSPKELGLPEIPGIYIQRDPSESFFQVFINLKKAAPFGRGVYGKVKRVLWLNDLEIVAKKVFANKKSTDPEVREHFEREVATLQMFSQKTGIISLIAAIRYDDRWALFMPAFDVTLWEFIMGEGDRLSLAEKLCVVSQWLKGLAIVAEKGIHGDLKGGNLLLRRRHQELKGVIADFGVYRSYWEKEHGLTAPLIAPPEYHTEKMVTSEQDVWAMGICLWEFFTEKGFFSPMFSGEQVTTERICQFTPDWILPYLPVSKIPEFIRKLINSMLDPRYKQRPTARQAFQQFSIGYAAMQSSSQEMEPENMSEKEDLCLSNLFDVNFV